MVPTPNFLLQQSAKSYGITTCQVAKNLFKKCFKLFKTLIATYIMNLSVVLLFGSWLPDIDRKGFGMVETSKLKERFKTVLPL